MLPQAFSFTASTITRKSSASYQSHWYSLLDWADINLLPWLIFLPEHTCKRQRKNITNSLPPPPSHESMLTFAPRLLSLLFFPLSWESPSRLSREPHGVLSCPKAQICTGGKQHPHAQVPPINPNQAKASSISFTHQSQGTENTQFPPTLDHSESASCSELDTCSQRWQFDLNQRKQSKQEAVTSPRNCQATNQGHSRDCLFPGQEENIWWKGRFQWQLKRHL